MERQGLNESCKVSQSSKAVKGWAIVGAASILYAIIIFLFNLDRFSRGANIHDLYIFESSFWNTLHGRVFYNFYEFGNHLGTHFSPGLFFLLPFYALWQSPLTLLLLQSIAVAGAGIPLYLLARKVLNNEVAAVFVPFIFWLYIPTLGAACSGFHESPFVMAPLFFLFWSREEKKGWLFWLFAVCVLLWKETYSFLLLFWGVTLIFTRKDRKTGFLLFLLSAIWALWAIFIIMPLVRGVPISEGMIQYRFPKEVGHSFGEILTNFSRRPGVFFQYAFERQKVQYLLALFSPLVFLPLISPTLLLPIIPQLAENLLSRGLLGVSLLKHYTAPVIPFLFYAGMISTSMLCRYFEKMGLSRKRFLRMLGLIILGVWICSFFRSDVFLVVFLKEKTKEEQLHYLFPEEISEAKRLGAMVPTEASLATSGHLEKYFARRKVISYVSPGFLRIFPFDYILFYPPSPHDDIFRRYPDLEKMRQDEYELVERSGRLFLYRRRPLPYSKEQQKLLDAVPK